MATITSPRDPSPPGGPRITSPAIPPSPSRTSTPTSSVRTSTDLPRNGAARASSSSPAPPSAAPSAPAQRRNRAALRDYYNLKSKTSPNNGSQDLSRTASVASNTSSSTLTSTAPIAAAATTADAAPPPSLTAQLDDPTFDTDTYIANLLHTASLRDILRVESALVSEVRNLDGERKALVYDNYSKLIKAVGTIGDMQRGMMRGRDRRGSGGVGGGLDGVEELETRLKGLEVVVRELRPERRDAEVEAKEEEGGQSRKSRTRKQRELVGWVLAAPARLEGYVEAGDRDQAEKEWVRVKTLLDQWGGVRGVDEVRSACEKALKGEDEEEDDEEDNNGNG